jgi:hypothetical protein
MEMTHTFEGREPFGHEHLATVGDGYACVDLHGTGMFSGTPRGLLENGAGGKRGLACARGERGKTVPNCPVYVLAGRFIGNLAR